MFRPSKYNQFLWPIAVVRHKTNLLLYPKLIVYKSCRVLCLLQFSFSEKATKICAIVIMVKCSFQPASGAGIELLSSHVLRRQQNFAKSQPWIWPLLHRTGLRWRFHNLRPSQNIWILVSRNRIFMKQKQSIFHNW